VGGSQVEAVNTTCACAEAARPKQEKQANAREANAGAARGFINGAPCSGRWVLGPQL